MKKIKLIQLPYQRFSHKNIKENHLNIPLAGGYLKAYCDSKDSKINLSLLGQFDTDLGGDAYILRKILDEDPILTGFTVNNFNIERTLYFITKLKEAKPELKTVLGGAEVSFYDNYPLSKSKVDYVIRGQGESPFYQLLQKVINKKGSLSEIPSLGYYEKGCAVFNSPSSVKNRLDCYPSPYLGGVLNKHLVGNTAYIESKRGCKYNCKFCYWGNRSEGKKGECFFSLDRIQKELEYLSGMDIFLVSFLDANFNYPRKRLYEIINLINKINYDGKFVFQCNLRAELVNREDAALLKKAGFKFVTTGLQTFNEWVLSQNTRTNHIESWLKGIKYLLEEGLLVSIEVILGLWGETPDTWKKLINFLVENDLHHKVICHILNCVPSSLLWKEKDDLGFVLQKKAPHLIIRNKDMTFQDIKTALIDIKETGIQMIGLDGLKDNTFPIFCDYLKGPVSKKIISDYDKRKPFTQLHIDLDVVVSKKRLQDEAVNLCERVSSSVLLKISSKDINNRIWDIVRFLNILSSANPYNVWNIVIDGNGIREDIIEKIYNSIFFKPSCLDYEGVYKGDILNNDCYRQSTRIFHLHPMGSQFVPLQFDFPYYDMGFMEIDNLNCDKTIKYSKYFSDGIIFDFSKDFQPEKVVLVFEELRGNFGIPKNIYFKNLCLQHIWNHFYGMVTVEPEGLDENIYSIGTLTVGHCFPKDKVKASVKQWLDFFAV